MLRPGATEATPLKLSGPAPAPTADAVSKQPTSLPSSSKEGFSTPYHAFVNQLKCLVGIGSLTLPWATSQVGLVLSLVGVLFLCYAAWEGIRLLVYCAADVLHRGSLGETKGGGGGEHDEGSGSWKRVSESAFGRWGWYATFLSLTLAQVGVATSYVDQTCWTINLVFGLSRIPSLALLWVTLSGLVMFINPGMRAVAWFSLVALLVYVYIYVLMVYYFARQGGVTPEFRTQPPLLFQPNALNIWYGPALFAFEGMGTALSVYESLGQREPRTFLNLTTASYFAAGVVYCSVMTVGYLAYGSSVQEVVLMNFPLEPLANSATYVLGLALACSFVLQMTPVFQACEAAIPLRHRSWGWVPTRIVLVGCTVLLAEAIPSVEQMVALTGALCFSVLCFVLPATMYLKLKPVDTPCPAYERVVAWALIPLGIVGAIGGVHGALTHHGEARFTYSG